MGTLLEGTLTVTPIPTLVLTLIISAPVNGSDYTVHQRHLWNDFTYTTTLKHVLHTYRWPLYNNCLLMTKDKDGPEDRQGAVYKIKSCDCQTTNIGETGGNLSTRLPEHKQVTRNGQWCLQSHCWAWALFTDKTSNWLFIGLCDMHKIF